jgi:GNAT superfamily N-acetyltransferase
MITGEWPMNSLIDTKVQYYKLRFAEERDVPLLLQLIKELAGYEQMSQLVAADEETLRQSLFERRTAEAVIGEYEGRPAGYSLFFHNISTFLGRPGIYVEDLYIKPELRGRGLGKAMLSFLAKLAVERHCGRMEWACLDWNKPSIGFYQSLGAKAMDEWTVYRMTEQDLTKLADEF